MSSKSLDRDVTHGNLFDALDLPRWAQDLQNHYWEAERKWKRLDEAYRLVLADILDRRGHDDDDA